MQDEEGLWQRVIEVVRYYPSPHNSQPIKISIVDACTADIYYDLDLGLPAESYGIPFGHVCAGVFLESLRIVAAKYGYATNEELFLDDLDFTSTQRLHRVARVSLVPHKSTQEDEEEFEAFVRRQTNRRPYDSRLVPDSIIDRVKEIASLQGYTFVSTADKEIVNDIVRVNQATLFDDLRNDAVYNEIMHWLRFSHQEARAKNDGLSAEAMIIPGKLLEFAMRHRSMWSFPVLGSIIRYVYLRTMRGVRQLGWLEGPFMSTAHYIEAGRTFMKIWIYLTRQNIYIHPFGTVITNPRSHKLFVAKAHIHEDSTTMAWMLFRFGYSKKPPKAFRRSAEAMIIKKETHGQDQ